ncbi:MAG: NAD(P)-dependent oxidoreductase [Lentilitoribacter sp.]
MFKIGLIGAGAMGGAIGTRFLDVGCELCVFDLDKVRVQELVDKGASAASSAANAAENADFVVFSLNSSRIVEVAAFGDAGAIEGASSETIFIDMSSVGPEETRDMAEKALARNVGWVDAPLSGGAPKALIGELTLMIGGEDVHVKRAMEGLKLIASNMTHMGPSGAGQTTKIINQVLCGLNFVAVAEATQLAIDAGVDASKIPGALAGGRADSAILQEFMPRYANKDYTRQGRLANMIKDLKFAQDLSISTNTSMPITAACMEIYKMLTAAGFGEEDLPVLMEYFKGPDRNVLNSD